MIRARVTKYKSYECWYRNKNNRKNRNFIRVITPSNKEEILSFKDNEITVQNVVLMVRYITRVFNDKLYIIDEHSSELNDVTILQHGRSYLCKRRPYMNAA